MARQIFAAEISHEDTPLALREKLAARESVVKEHLRKLNQDTDEVFVISSCNRFTIYAIAEDISPLTRFFDEYPALKGYVQFYYNTEESITHLFAVASGLLSPIKGDHQILDQLKQSHRWARETNSIGITFDNLLQEADRLGRKVRTQTGIDKFCSSVVDAGIEVLYNRIHDLHSKEFLIVGTGKIARLALEYLYNEGMQHITIVSRNIERARELATLYNVSAAPMEAICGHAENADVIIGATYHEVSLFQESYLSAFSDRDKMWFILDFGMPRNFNDKLGDHASIELYNLDDLKRLYKSPLDAFGGVQEAWTMVMREARAFMQILAQLEFSPILVAYWSRLADIKNRHARHIFPSLDEKLSKQDLARIKARARKLMHHLTGESLRNNRTLVNNYQAGMAADIVKNLQSFSIVRLNLSLN